MFCSGCFVLSDWTLFLGCFRRMVLDYDSMECILPGSISYSPLFYLPCLLLHVYCPLDCSYVHSVFMLTASPRLFAEPWKFHPYLEGTAATISQRRRAEAYPVSQTLFVTMDAACQEQHHHARMLDAWCSAQQVWFIRRRPGNTAADVHSAVPGCWNSSGGPVAE